MPLLSLLITSCQTVQRFSSHLNVSETFGVKSWKTALDVLETNVMTLA